MNCKTTKHRLCGVVLIVALTLLVVLPVQAVSANHGLRVVAVRGQVVAHVTRVETRISRTLSTRVLAPQRLRVAIIGADGSVRAAHVRVVGAAQLARGSARDAVLVTRLNAVAAPDDRLVVEWVTASLWVRLQRDLYAHTEDQGIVDTAVGARIDDVLQVRLQA